MEYEMASLHKYNALQSAGRWGTLVLNRVVLFCGLLDVKQPPVDSFSRILPLYSVTEKVVMLLRI